jgi:hypothetical protein
MIQYLRNVIDRLTGFILGIIANPDKWAKNDITVDSVKAVHEKLVAKEKEIEDLKKLLSQKQIEARELQIEGTKFADKLENFIFGYHSDEPQKLINYGLTAPRSNAKKQAPVNKLTLTIEDDTDEVGFIITTQSDPDAELYEFYKGYGADAAKTDVIPPMTHLKTTKKISYVDDDVPKGVRVFYKVRATNSKGEGPWSEAASRVQ